MAGLVLAKHAEPGEMLAAGAPVVTIARMDEVWLRGYIPEAEVGRVAIGQRARVTADAWPGRVLEGRVSFISSEAEFTPKNVQTEKERVKLVYRIKVTLPNPKGELKPGMPVDAVIVTTP
jgi:HlyD family secretion protein